MGIVQTVSLNLAAIARDRRGCCPRSVCSSVEDHVVSVVPLFARLATTLPPSAFPFPGPSQPIGTPKTKASPPNRPKAGYANSCVKMHFLDRSQFLGSHDRSTQVADILTRLHRPIDHVDYPSLRWHVQQAGHIHKHTSLVLYLSRAKASRSLTHTHTA